MKRTRGIGPRQRAVLSALLALEAEHADDPEGCGAFYVWAVAAELAATDPGVINEGQARENTKRLRDDYWARKERDAMALLASRRELGRPEDAEATAAYDAALDTLRITTLAAELKRSRSSSSIGRPRIWSEEDAWMDKALNLTRIFGLLEQRGLVVRPGHGVVGLTDAGRAMVQ